jgi:hypothetical protein
LRSVVGVLGLLLAIVGAVTMFSGAFVGMTGYCCFPFPGTIYLLIGVGAAAVIVGLVALLWVGHLEHRDTDRRTDW